MPRSPAPAQPPDEGRERRGVHAQRRRVGEDGRAARLGHERQSLLRGHAAVGDRGRPAVGEVAVEGVLAVARVAGGDDRVGDVGAADRTGGAGGDVLERHRRARLGQAADDLAGARLPRRPQLLEPVGERPRRGLAEVREQVHRARGGPHRQLDGRHHPQAARAAGADGCGHAAERVVVGDRHDGHALAGGQLDQRRGLERPVGGDGVEVEVGPAGGYAVTARPTRPRASSSARTRAALSAADSSSVRTCTSGLGGGS